MTRRLRISFEASSAFQAEYAQNIVNGGAFVPTTELCDLREIAEVELDMAFAGESLVLEAEVVHCQSGVGVAVQFLSDAAELRQHFAPFLAAASAAEPPEAPEQGASRSEGPSLEREPAPEPERERAPALELDESPGVEIEIELSDPPAAEPLELTPEELPVVEAENTPVPLELRPVETGSPEDTGPPEDSGPPLDTGSPENSGGGYSVESAAELDLEEVDLGAGGSDPSAFGADFDADALDPSQLDGRDPFLPGAEESGLEPPAIELDSELPPQPLSLGPLKFEDPLSNVEDRRGSPRAAAHVRARLDASNVSLDGVTRDLSETGALISADASELPLGKQVRLEFTHPMSGERLDVVGTVKRHVKTEGTVAAVGVEFDSESETAPQISDFVKQAKEVEAARIEAGISGMIEEIGMANLLQMLGGSSEEGTLTVSRGTEEGVITFRNGLFVAACLGSLTGLKALTRLLSWNDGTFRFHSQLDSLPAEEAPTPLDGAVFEAVRRLDEARRSEASHFQPGMRFRIERDALAGETDLGKTEEAVLDLVGVGCTLRRILDVIPESDAQVLEALRSLEERGLILADG